MPPKLTSEEQAAVRAEPRLARAAYLFHVAAEAYAQDTDDNAVAERRRREMNAAAAFLDEQCVRVLGEAGLAKQVGRGLRTVSMETVEALLAPGDKDAMDKRACRHCRTFESLPGPLARHEKKCRAVLAGEVPAGRARPSRAKPPVARGRAPEPDAEPSECQHGRASAACPLCAQGDGNDRFGVKGGNVTTERGDGGDERCPVCGAPAMLGDGTRCHGVVPGDAKVPTSGGLCCTDCGFLLEKRYGNPGDPTCERCWNARQRRAATRILQAAQAGKVERAPATAEDAHDDYARHHRACGACAEAGRPCPLGAAYAMRWSRLEYQALATVVQP